MLRLDNQERDAFAIALQEIGGRFFVFGSRTDPRKKRGGDIDLLVLTQVKNARLSRKIIVPFQMMCETKIDVMSVHPDQQTPVEKAFLKLSETFRPLEKGRQYNDAAAKKNSILLS